MKPRRSGPARARRAGAPLGGAAFATPPPATRLPVHPHGQPLLKNGLAGLAVTAPVSWRYAGLLGDCLPWGHMRLLTAR